MTRTVATVKLAKLRRNRKKGIAKLIVKVPGKGRLKLTGKGIKKQRPAAGAASASKLVKGRGRVKLRIKAKGRKKRKLDRAGKVKVKVKVVFKPKGGDRNVQRRKVKLLKRP